MYSVLIDHSGIEVWILDESNGETNWASKQLVCHLPRFPDPSKRLQSSGPWTSQRITSHGDSRSNDGLETAGQEKFEWDFENDDLLYPDDGARWGYQRFLAFLAYKEVIFLNDTMRRVLACHLNISKIQDLGSVYSEADKLCNQGVSVESSFMYTPCWMSDFPVNVTSMS